MKVMGRYIGKLGDIAIWESEKTGDRFYLEGETFQSQSSAAGESRFPYVNLMEAFLEDAKSVLLLGCGGGNLATMLARSGKKIAVVDYNPVSFEIARKFFGMPEDIPCIVDDFRDYLRAETRCFDGVAIDVGGPGFCYEEQLDSTTCRSVLERLNPGGRVILNMIAASDYDAAPDQIGTDLSCDEGGAWIIDQPGFSNRNVLIACLPKLPRAVAKRSVARLCKIDGDDWVLRRPRWPSHDSEPVVIKIECAD